jgi:predicted SAM-dependent methyltransferase
MLTEELRVSLISELSYDDYFDVITASHVLEHFTYQNIKTKLKEVYDNLKPGGIFLCEVPHGASQLTKFQMGQRPATQRLEPHTLFFSSYSLCRMMAEIGFQIKKTNMCQWTKENICKEVFQKSVKGADIFKGPLTILARKPI